MDDLTAALESAPAEEELRSNLDKREYTQEYIEQVASDALDMASDLVKDPLVHKVMAMMIVNRMITWHTIVGEAQLKEGRAVVYQSGMVKALWASYRGKVQAAKHREGLRLNRTRDDYQKEVVELRDKISLYEHALEKVAKEVGLDVNEFVSQLVKN